MKAKSFAVAAALLAFGWSAGAQVAPRTHMFALINELDGQFVCPETLASDADRSAALTAFAKRLAASNVNYAQATRILDLMLKRHNCSATVAEPVSVTATADVEPAPLPAPTMTVAANTPSH